MRPAQWEGAGRGAGPVFVACAVALMTSAAASAPASPSVGEPASASVAIGLFVPLEGEDAPAGLEARRGAAIAVAHANREIRVGEPAVRLVPVSSARPWEAGASALARLIYDQGAEAVVGALDARAAHLAEQVITRARGRAVFVTPWVSETTLSRLRIPWFFSVAPDDGRQAGALVEEIFRRRGGERALAWVEDSFDARAAAAAFVEAAPPGHVTLFAADAEGREALAAALDEEPAGALVLFASPRRAADLAEWLRRRGPSPPLFGTLALAVPAAPGPGEGALQGMWVVTSAGSDSGRAAAFAREFRQAYGSPPTPLAAYAHDAVAVVAKAIRARTPSRAGAASLESVLAVTTLDGATGTVRFDRHRTRDGAPAVTLLAREDLAPEAAGAPPCPVTVVGR